MYTIELTRGVAWDAPVIEVHSVRPTIHIVDVDRMAQAMLTGARQTSPLLRPTNYRVLDPLGRCVRSSATAPKVFTWRAGRTCWN
jgi:hypothetical protein